MKIYLLLASVLAVIMGGCAKNQWDGLFNVFTAPIALLAGDGCASSDNTAFDKNYFPKHQYYVGGGIEVAYTAWEEGTLIVADRNSKKIILTESLGREDGFEFPYRSESWSEKLMKIGVDPTKMELSLYFIPYDGDDKTKK